MSVCNCPDCYARRGWKAPRVTNVTMNPPTVAAESLADALVADVAGRLLCLREKCYGGVAITDDQVRERAAAIVQGLILEYDIKPRAGGLA